MVRYKVTLTAEERSELGNILKKGRHTSLQFRNACILLNCDESAAGKKYSNEDIARMLQVTTKTVERLKQRFVEEGFDVCLGRKPYPEVTNIKTDGDFEAHLLALSCSEAPEGYARWSLRMLADKMVELKYVESISHERVRQTLKKRNQTVAGQGLDNPAIAGRELCILHGKATGCLQGTLRSPASGCLHGQNAETVDKGDPPAVATQTRQ